MTKEELFEKLKAKVEVIFRDDFSGHDYFHTIRVFNLALNIAEKEGANLEYVGIAALLHDVDDYKLFGGEIGGCSNAVAIMNELGIEQNTIDEVCQIIKKVSFKGTDTETPETIEGRVVQDADRLDAIGAIGIARAFAYGGSKDRQIYNPNIEPKLNMDKSEYIKNEGTSINHFYEKLLSLKDMMGTETGKKIAQNRHKFMEEYLKEFFDEWNGAL